VLLVVSLLYYLVRPKWAFI